MPVQSPQLLFKFGTTHGHPVFAKFPEFCPLSFLPSSLSFPSYSRGFSLCPLGFCLHRLVSCLCLLVPFDPRGNRALQ